MRILFKLSGIIASVEKILGASLGLLIMVLILLNVVTRAMSSALFWVDEAAISAMVWMAFLGSSLALHHKKLVAVTLLPDMLAEPARRYMGIAVDVSILIFAITLVILNWRWFDPLTLISNGFDTKAFAGDTFNFIYAETTTTLGIRKFWLWLILPIFSFNITVHALANLVEHKTGERAAATARPAV